jgi:ureidoacrylate peracid hydrolase
MPSVGAGAIHPICVESTLRDGYHREYFGIVLADATHQAGPPALQEGALLNIETFFGWVSDVAAFEAALHSDEARRIPV